MKAQQEISTIEAVQDVAWFDERPQCKHLQACWRAGEDTSERCGSYGRRRPGYCPINGGTCAMEDPDWTFAPGWDTWAEWMDQGHEHIDMEFWPGLKAGDLAAYEVTGTCMVPTWPDGALAVVRIGNTWNNGDACVISKRMQGIPLKGKLAYLKRLERIGSRMLQITADNPDFSPFLMPVDAIRVRGVALEGVAAADVRDRLVICTDSSRDKSSLSYGLGLHCRKETSREMPFQIMAKMPYPPRLWVLVGYPGSGKSTFATQMKGPILVVDADHRFREVMDLVLGDVYELSAEAGDNTDADRISTILAENMPASDVATIVVDSLTSIITPIITQAMIDKDAGREKNLAAAWRKKALAMRQLQDAVTRYGTDVLWIYHLHDARDEKAREIVKATLSETERARLTRSINLQIELVQDEQGRRGAKVVWARRGRSGMTLWDDTGRWRGMPEKLEVAVYGGLTRAEQEAIERSAPEVFPNPETAIAWGFEQGAFEALQHARNAYHKLKREKAPGNAREMAELWVADVRARLNGSKSPEDPGGEAAARALWPKGRRCRRTSRKESSDADRKS